MADRSGLRRARAGRVAWGDGQRGQRNAIAWFVKYTPSINFEVRRAVRRQGSLHSASFAVMPCRWLVRLEFLYEMMTLKIWNHG